VEGVQGAHMIEGCSLHTGGKGAGCIQEEDGCRVNKEHSTQGCIYCRWVQGAGRPFGVHTGRRVAGCIQEDEPCRVHAGRRGAGCIQAGVPFRVHTGRWVL
jgi:hypothetical protein